MPETPALVIGGRYGQMTELARLLPELRLVQTYTAGTDWLDVAALDQLGVKVSDNNGANANTVAEHTIALIFSVYHKLDQQFKSVQAGNWQEGVCGPRSEMHTLVGKRIGLVGLGRIGSRVARRLQGWECELFFCDVANFEADYIRQCNAQRLSFDELLSSCDVVSLHVPLNRLTPSSRLGARINAHATGRPSHQHLPRPGSRREGTAICPAKQATTRRRSRRNGNRTHRDRQSVARFAQRP
mgnify:CR=1 FL=1